MGNSEPAWQTLNVRKEKEGRKGGEEEFQNRHKGRKGGQYILRKKRENFSLSDDPAEKKRKPSPKEKGNQGNGIY